LSASAVTSGPMPSPPTTASLMVRELMAEPYWRVAPDGARVATTPLRVAPLPVVPLAAPFASPPLSRRSSEAWTAFSAGLVPGLVTRRRGVRMCSTRAWRAPFWGLATTLASWLAVWLPSWLAAGLSQAGYMSYTEVLLIENQIGLTASS
jgi:hypothetical protein